MNGIIDMLTICLITLGRWAILPTGLILLVCLIFGPRVRTLCFLAVKWIGVLLVVTGGLIAYVTLRDGLASEGGGGLIFFGFLALLPILGEFLALLGCWRWRCRIHDA